jgi:uncharacterized membrane protein
MSMPPPLIILHVSTATIGLLSGFAALSSRKGARVHRQAGTVFFISMLFMAATAAYLAIMKTQTLNAIVGVLTFYMVATAWLTVKRRAGKTGRIEYVLALLAVADGASAFVLGNEASLSATGLQDGTDAAPYFVFGSFALIAAALDFRMLLRNGVSGGHRIARHLWRMCFALLITSLSFFQGTRIDFPEALRRTHLLWVPTLIVAVAMIYWLCRVLVTKTYKGASKLSGLRRDAAVGAASLRQQEPL